MSKITKAGALVLCTCASALLVRAQVQQSSTDSSAVIRATTRLVQLDVVVTDSSGHPAKDRLSEKDFSLSRSLAGKAFVLFVSTIRGTGEAAASTTSTSCGHEPARV